jgi:hypothetical protein
MNISDYGKEIVSLLVPLVTWVINVGLKPRARLHWTSPHSFTYIVQEPLHDPQGVVVRQNQTVSTASVQITNAGRETATKVEVVFNWKPQYMNLWPVRSFEQRTDADGRHMMIFENLAPKEDVGIQIMSINRDLPGLLQVRSAECVARQVQLMSFPRVPTWRVRLGTILMFCGLAALIYWLITLLQVLVLKTPLSF